MKIRRTVIYISLATFFAACTNDDYFSSNGVKPLKSKGDSIIILQDRNPDLTTVWTKDVPKRKIQTRSYFPLEDYIGVGYNVGNSLIGEYSNATDAVIDLEKLRSRFSKAITAFNISETKIEKTAYTDYDRYEKNTSVTKTVKSGFSLNLKLFKFGRKKETTEIFKTTNITESNRVYGEVSIKLQQAQYKLNTTNVVLKTIASECLDEVFQMSLYLTPISEILNDYGPLVISGYYTGGRASALFVASSDYKFDYESTEKDVQEHIEASFSWGKKGLPKDSLSSASGNLDFGKNTGNNISNTNKVKDVHCYIHTIGGLGTIETSAESIENMNIDLTPWLRTLSDQSNHVMIGLRENGEGLIGLSELVLEMNFKQRIQDTHMSFTSNIEMTEPFIEIVKVFVRNSSSGEKLYEIAPVLNTRQGDQIILSDGKSSQASDAELKANSSYDTFMAKSKIITDEKSKYYQCEIKANSNKTLNPIIRIPFNINLPGLSESNMYKFKNPNTNIWYIYDPVKRYAYSFYDIDNFIPETYGMNNWINTVPEKAISMTTLSQFYKIIGL